MSLSLKPTTKPIDARFELPGSKSYANRALVCAALSDAPCFIRNISPAEDTALMLNLLADLGWQVTRANPLSRDLQLRPPARPAAHDRIMYTGAAGTVARFATALLTVIPGRFTLDGNDRMRERPMSELIHALNHLGAHIFETRLPGCLPLEIVGGKLRGGKCTLKGDVSSQFVSALLLVAPTRAGGIEITIDGELVSKPYVEMTLEVMRAFGVPDSAISRDSYARIHVNEAPYRPTEYTCPPDATAASYFWGAAAVTGGVCVIDGLTRQDTQGDAQFAAVLGRMGCEVQEFPNGLGVRGPNTLKPVNADMADMPDCAQTLAVVCAFAAGTSRLTGLSTLRVKETDRIAALEAELGKLGVATRSGPDWLEVDGGTALTPDVQISTYDDHRMAMSFAIAGLRVPLAIKDPGCVDKSFPTFWEYWDKLK
jgi:3-phosphoshikimate 1-carboxyvinyltransferase